MTTKKVHLKSIIHELIWFLNGSTNIAYLKENGVSIWDEWTDVNGDLGPIYGYQWRIWPAPNGEHIDQISQVLDQIRNNPDSRRMIVSAWNISDVPQMKLPPCHAFFRFYVAEAKLSCQLYQRSADIFLGVSFNIASYALLTHMMAQQAGLEVGYFVWIGGDCHLYSNHLEQVELEGCRRLGRQRHPPLALCGGGGDAVRSPPGQHAGLLSPHAIPVRGAARSSCHRGESGSAAGEHAAHPPACEPNHKAVLHDTSYLELYMDDNFLEAI